MEPHTTARTSRRPASMYNTGLYNAIQGLEVYQGIAVVRKLHGQLLVGNGRLCRHHPRRRHCTQRNTDLWRKRACLRTTTVDYGTAIPPVTPDETTIQYATTT